MELRFFEQHIVEAFKLTAVTFGAICIATLGAAVAVWSYPYPRAALLQLSFAASNVVVFSGLGILVASLLRRMLGKLAKRWPMSAFFLGFTIESILIVVVFYFIFAMHGLPQRFAACAYGLSLCNKSVNETATPDDLKAIGEALNGNTPIPR